MFKIMLRCGLRLEETANLTKDAVDLELQQLIVYNGKGKKDRVAFYLCGLTLSYFQEMSSW